MKAASCLTTLFSCLFLFCTPSIAALPEPVINTLDGLVVGVSEGDQITVNSFGTEINVRLYGIAAPQTAKVDKFTGWSKPGQPFSEDAFRALSIKVLHQQVKVEIRRTLVFKHETKQVALAVVYFEGRNINQEMVADGWAWAYKKLANRGDFVEYLKAEKKAKAKKNGLWSQPTPLPPWEFRPKLNLVPATRPRP